jgi:hypothetical protein
VDGAFAVARVAIAAAVAHQKASSRMDTAAMWTPRAERAGFASGKGDIGPSLPRSGLQQDSGIQVDLRYSGSSRECTGNGGSVGVAVKCQLVRTFTVRASC